MTNDRPEKGIKDAGEGEWTYRGLKIKLGGKWGYIDTKGNMVIKPQFDSAGPFSEVCAVVFTAPDNFTRLTGVIDKKGVYVLKPSDYFNAFNFSGGLALVITNDDKWMYVDKKGKIIWKTE